MADEDDRPFADRVAGVKRLAADRRRVVRTKRPSQPAREGAATGPGVRFERPRADQPLLGFAPGVDRASFRRLRSGAWRPDRRIDLHGCDRTAARREVRTGLLAARDEGSRCVLVIHGRGRGSAGEPVLRDALPGWLEEPPLARAILAFAPARPEDGGAGALYVLLRRRDDAG